MKLLVDTHAHLTDNRFTGETDAVLTRAREAGVAWVVTIASDLADAEAALRLARDHSGVYATVGIHPHTAEQADAASFARIEELARTSGAVAIGETGLDYHYDHSPRAEQLLSFDRHLEIAERVDRPVVVHARSADDDVRAAIRNAGWPRGVLHCFSSGGGLLDDAIELGWYISFGGMISFPRWDGADLLRRVPADRLLLETDSPYLAPVPHRGKRNEPAFVRLIAERAAEIRAEDADALAEQTTRNALEFYGLTAVMDS